MPAVCALRNAGIASEFPSDVLPACGTKRHGVAQQAPARRLPQAVLTSETMPNGRLGEAHARRQLATIDARKQP